MVTCRDIVARAMKMAGILGQGEMPEAEELDSGMTVLQSMYDQWLAGGMFGRLLDAYQDGDYEAKANQRVYVNEGIGTLPDFTELNDTDECRWRDLAAVEIYDTNGRRAYVWDRDAWVRIDNLLPGDDAPLAMRGANGLAACLAVYYAEEYGAQIGAGAALQARNFKFSLATRYGTQQDLVPGVYF